MYGWGRWEGQTLAGCCPKSEKTRKVRARMSSLLNILESIFSLILKLIFFEIFYSRQYVIISSARNVRQFQKWMNHKIWIYITPIWSLMSIYCWIQQYILIRSHTTNKMMPYNNQYDAIQQTKYQQYKESRVSTFDLSLPFSTISRLCQ